MPIINKKQSMWIFALLLLLMPAVSQAQQAYFIAPNGNNSANGTSPGSPWQTFARAIPALQAGDTLHLLNGVYTTAVNGNFHASCAGGGNANHGTSTNRITIRAMNERQAWIQGNGTDIPLRVYYCHYWTIEGLRVSSADNASNVGNGSVVEVDQIEFAIMRRLLIHNNNRWENGSCFGIASKDSLFEENEVYYCHRNVMTFGYSSYSPGPGYPAERNIFRRNYLNGRGYADLPGCTGVAQAHDPATPRCSGTTVGADGGITCYPCNNNTFENNIVEGGQGGFDIQCDDIPCLGNRYMGNMALNNEGGSVFTIRDEGHKPDAYMENHLTMNNTNHGIYWRGTEGTHCHKCSAINNGLSGFVADRNTYFGNWPPYTVSVTNSLAINNGQYAFYLIDQDAFTFTNVWSFGNAGGHAVPPLTSPGFSDTHTTDPGLGTCRVAAPVGSPARAANAGAEILYRYQNGTITTQPLWDTTTNQFPCGATVSGFNTTAGDSCVNVHQRLNVNTNGCTLPPVQTVTPVVGTFYIATTGSSTVDCTAAQNPATPRNSMAVVAPCAAGGSTITYSAGTYTETIQQSVIPLPSGMLGTPTIVTARQVEGVYDTVVLKSSCCGTILWLDRGSESHDMIFDHLTFDGENVSGVFPIYLDSQAQRITVRHSTIKNSNNGTGFTAVASDGITFDSNTILDTIGNRRALEILTSTNVTVTRNQIVNSVQGGIYSTTGSLNLILGENTLRGHTAPAISLGGGSGNLVRNNILYNNQVAIEARANEVGSLLYNNTIDTNSVAPLRILTGASAITYRNNLLTNNGNGNAALDSGTGTIASHNLTVDPLYVQPGSGNFHLQIGSPAINAGMALAQVTLDADGMARTGLPDVGAYEFAGVGPAVGTYYVALASGSPAGDDSRDCTQAQTPATPKATLASALPCAAGGSTLYLYGGTYPQALLTTSMPIAPGSAGARTLIASVPGETATLRPTGSAVVWLSSPTAYLTLRNLIFDGALAGTTPNVLVDNGVQYVRFESVQILNAQSEGALVRGTTGIEFLNSTLQTNAATNTAGLYAENSSGLVVRSGTISAMANHGIQLNGMSATLVEQVRIHTNGNTGIASTGGTGLLVVNNLIYANAAGILLLTGETGAKLYHNTLWSNTGLSLQIVSGATNTLHTNNIYYQNGTNTPLNTGGATNVGTTNFTSDPGFIAPGPPTSFVPSFAPPIDAGTTLAEVSIDYGGASRDSTPTIGALEGSLPNAQTLRGFPWASTGGVLQP